jgi:peptide/nickel transport system substrate-binding protein
MVQQAQARYLPSFKQLKYIGRFLNDQEKKLLRALSLFLVVIILSAGAFYMYLHIDQVAAEGGEYTEGMVGQPKYLNPLFASSNEVDSDISSLIYSGLFSYNNQRELVPDLAQSYKVSDDRKVYDVMLKPDLRWSDGERLTAQDVIFTFETIQNREAESPLVASFQGVALEKVNDLTVRFTLKQPFAPFLQALTVGIVPEHTWGAIDNPAHLKLAKMNLEPVGSGSWRFDRLVKRDVGGIDSISLVRNENYYGVKPFIRTLTFRFYPDQGSILDDIRLQKVLAISFPPRTTSTVAYKNNKEYPIYLPQYTALFFNQEANSDLKDKSLRKALTVAINKDQLLQNALFGDAQRVEGPILPGMLGYADDLVLATGTIDDANEVLDKGWQRIQPEEYFKLRYTALEKAALGDAPAKKTTTTTDRDPDLVVTVQKEMSAQQSFYRRDKKNHVLSFTITTVDTPEYERVAEEIARSWQALGVQTTVKLINRQFFLRNVIKSRDYDMVLYGEVVGGDPDPFPFWDSSQSNYPGLNLSGYANRSVDKLLEDARVTIDPQERAKLYHTFQQTLVDDLPAIFLYTPVYHMLINKDVHQVEIPQLVVPSDRYRELAGWYIKTRWVWKK